MKKVVVLTLLALGVAQPAFAQDSVGASGDKSGFRVEARASYETPTVSSVVEDDDVYKLGSAFAFGGELGFDIAASEKIVVGPYATYEVSSVENCEDGACVKATDNYAAGLHAGLKAGPGGLIYTKVGYASLGLEVTADGIEESERGDGFQAALGYEHGFGEHVYGRLELGYADNGDIFGINFQRRHAGLSLGARF